jgi:hypothetical protein
MFGWRLCSGAGAVKPEAAEHLAARAVRRASSLSAPARELCIEGLWGPGVRMAAAGQLGVVALRRPQGRAEGARERDVEAVCGLWRRTAAAG